MFWSHNFILIIFNVIVEIGENCFFVIMPIILYKLLV